MRFFLSIAMLAICCQVWLLEAKANDVAASRTVERANSVWDETMGLTVQAIPQALLANAHAVALVPDVVKVGLVVGGRHGRGVLITRDEAGRWQAPTFIEMTGGSVGWQVGVQRTDVVLVFKNREGVENILQGRKFTLGADAGVAAGPVGRQAEAATDGQLRAEVYSYSRSRGLFAGVALEGSVISVDNNANAAYYRQGEPVPQGALTLVSKLAQYSQPMAGNLQPVPNEPQPMELANAMEGTRQSLIAAHSQLQPKLDATWRNYLPLPEAIVRDPRSVSPQMVQDVLKRFDRVAGDPKYAMLTSTNEFQQVHELLGRYFVQVQETTGRTVGLPPPPKP